jgi:hypothetical protein
MTPWPAAPQAPVVRPQWGNWYPRSCATPWSDARHVKDNDDSKAVDAKQKLVSALEKYHKSHFRLGKALAAYKEYYAEARGWMAAAKVISDAWGCDERTIRRIVECYELAAEIPSEAIAELEALGLDPGAKRNQSIIKTISVMPRSEVEAAPKETVTTVVEADHLAKAEQKENAIKKSKVRKLGKAAKKPPRSFPPAGTRPAGRWLRKKIGAKTSG